MESIQSTGQDGMDTVAMEIDSNAESVKYRSPPRKNSPRAVSAIDNRHDQGQSNNGKEGGGDWGGRGRRLGRVSSIFL